MAIISKTFTFSPGAVILASEHNTNFDTLYTLVNGNIDNNNIKTSAGIVYSKLSLTNSVVLADLASAIKSGDDATLITGTAGTDGYLSKWNADGDLVDGYEVLDEDNMASNSATKLATQQSIKAYADSVFPAYLNGATYTEASALTERTRSTASWAMVKEFSPLLRSGNVTITWKHKIAGGGGSAQSRLYINDVAVGTAQTTTSTSYEDETETNVSVVKGDVIQIYGYGGAASNELYVDDVYIKCLNPTSVQEAT